jgi:protease IV
MDLLRSFDELRRRRKAPYLLELDLTQPLLEDKPPELVVRLLWRRRASLASVLRALDDGRTDARVAGLVAKIGPRGMGFAQAQELRDAVRAFSATGKPAVAWSETFGEFAAATVPYYLATAFGEVWLQPSGEIGFVGVASSSLFLAEALDNAGVRRQIGTRHEYKNAANMFLERDFTEPQREATGRVVASLWQQVVDGVANSRQLEAGTVRELADRAPLAASEAQLAHLVDHIGYRDEVYDALRRKRPGAQFLFVHRYRAHRAVAERLRQAVPRRRGVVALVVGNGQIRLGRSGQGAARSSAMGSDTVSAALRAALESDRVRAVVFRVNSPGGSYVASDTIWREVGRLRESGKPVVVSMGDVAASGGYFVAAPADAIVAGPGTLTGSIGVLGGKFSVGDLLARFGARHGSIGEGRHARMMSPLDEFTEEEWQQLSAWLDKIYDDFVGKVAAGRSMAREAVSEVARGRVWTGADARERGLVDELGGLERATVVARQRAGLPAGAELVSFPHISPAQRLRPPRSSEDPRAAAAVVLGPWGPFGALAARLGLPPSGPLTMPPMTVR